MDIPCPTCNATGNLTVHATTIDSNGSHPHEPVELTCVSCKGKKTVPEAYGQALKEMNESWCECSRADQDRYGVEFYDNGEHPDLHKHHYRCVSCKKIVQIG